MSTEPKRVSITGGTGFVGSHIIQALLAKHFEVRALARNPNQAALNHPSLKFVPGDLHSTDVLNNLLSDANYVIHCAGRVRGATQQQFDHDNVEGTQNIIDACKQAGSLKKLIIISSLAAREPEISYYSSSKKDAEELISNIDFARWSIIRPPAVYGPNDRELLPLFNWMKKGILWIPGNLEQKFSLIHAYDLAEFTIHQMLSHTSGEILEPDDGEHYDWTLISQLCSEIFNRKIRKIIIPKTALSFVANLNVLLSSLVNYTPMLTPSKVRELMHEDWLAKGIDPSYGWTAKVDLKQGLGTIYSSLSNT